MAQSPAVSTDYPGAAPTFSAGTGYYRVVRIHRHVTEAFVQATSIANAVAAAKALTPNQWKTRAVKQPQPQLTDQFEYDVVASDPAAPTYGTNDV
ncbi:hypothetical protein M2322_002671 [Rhodoblastus acidophilus]|uniref:hypothetical protein n=1 Tax=Rhodoblastus acidophilus TaxID=1074 RepID=UPI002223F09E|nr:hypothetical protein [Rhodoblastus acidophilus]MCW2317117.1 hypothetical protein [Rhodoblastus acidophilus]